VKVGLGGLGIKGKLRWGWGNLLVKCKWLNTNNLIGVHEYAVLLIEHLALIAKHCFEQFHEVRLAVLRDLLLLLGSCHVDAKT